MSKMRFDVKILEWSNKRKCMSMGKELNWVVRSGNVGIEPPPEISGFCIIGNKNEQKLFVNFLENTLKIPTKEYFNVSSD